MFLNVYVRRNNFVRAFCRLIPELLVGGLSIRSGLTGRTLSGPLLKIFKGCEMKLLGYDRCETQENRGSDYFVVMFKMKTIIAIVLLIGLGGCTITKLSPDKMDSKLNMVEQYLGERIWRYENSEAICFARYRNGFHCEMKK